MLEDHVQVHAENVTLAGTLGLMPDAHGLALFAHSSGSSRYSPRSRYVADVFHRTRMATLLVDLLTPDEEGRDVYTAQYRYDIPLLAERLVGVADWLSHNPDTQHLPLGCFGANTGAAAALIAAADHPDSIQAVVSRGGRPDLAGPALGRVQAPTLLIVGEKDQPVIALNHEAFTRLRSVKRIDIVPGATHLFPEPGALEEVARLAHDWFARHLHSESGEAHQAVK